MTGTRPLAVRIQIAGPTAPREVAVEVDSARTVAELLAVLVREHGLSPRPDWVFELNGEPVDPGRTLRELVGMSGSRPPLQLVLRTALPGEPAPADDADLDYSFGATADEDEEDEAPVRRVEAPARRAPPAATPAKAKRARAPSGGAGGYGGSGRLDATAAAHEERPLTERQATVRYYSRMNPDRMFPLLVILSAKQVEEVVKKAVKQAASEAFKVEEGSRVEIEPVLPGCDCYPPRHTLAVEAKDAVTETFWIVPRVLGRVHGARVLVRQGDRVLAEVPLDVKVSKQTLAVACGLLSLAAPYLTMGLKSLKLDYESQKADGFPLYQQAGSWIAENLRPEWLGLGFLGLAFLLYLWMRPKRRDVFWDLSVK